MNETILLTLDASIMNALNTLAESCNSNANDIVKACINYCALMISQNPEETMMFMGILKTIEMSKDKEK